jgi:hypothetical protein
VPALYSAVGLRVGVSLIFRVDKHLGGGPCRGFIIANDIPEGLAIPVSRVAGVSLAKYHMSFAIEPAASN